MGLAGVLATMDDVAGELGNLESKDHYRSHSVPPEIEESPVRQTINLPGVEGRFVQTPTALDFENGSGNATGYGAGGQLSKSRKDPTRFRVTIEGNTTEFELSLVDTAGATESQQGSANPKRVFDGRDEFQAFEAFERAKVSYDSFLEDDSIVSDERLVIRWAGEQ